VDGSLSALSTRYHVPLSTLHRWRVKINENPEWTPFETEWGAHRRVFSDLTESILALFIRDQFLHKHRLFTTEDFQTLDFERSREVYRDAENAPRFICSCWFVKGFMKRNRFSLRRQHFKRRPAASEEEVEQWVRHVSHLLETEDTNLILNCDETAWRLYPNNILTWWNTGTDDVSIHVNGDEKGMITVLATISANRKKWPLFSSGRGRRQKWKGLRSER
jgi:hypothetical protein